MMTLLRCMLSLDDEVILVLFSLLPFVSHFFGILDLGYFCIFLVLILMQNVQKHKIPEKIKVKHIIYSLTLWILLCAEKNGYPITWNYIILESG